MKCKDVAVIGLGRFGSSLARTLQSMGVAVLGVDLCEEHVNGLAGVLTETAIADITDVQVVQELGLRNFDHVVVAIGQNIAASLMLTVMLKDLDVKHIIAKASSDLHGKALRLVGADQVVFPERDMGARLAKHLIAPNLLEFIELSPVHSLIELTVAGALVGKTLRQLDLRNKYSVNVIGLRSGQYCNLSPIADDMVKEGDILVLVGETEGLERLQSDYGL